MGAGWGADDTGATVRVTTPRPGVVRVVVHDRDGREVARRRTDDGRTRLVLPPGTYALAVDDDRPLHDPRRLTGTRLRLTVPAGPRIEAAVSLGTAAALRVTVTTPDGAPARFARVAAVRAGERLETRTDGHGRAVLAGLPAGGWTLEATDARRRRVAEPVPVEVRPGDDAEVDLPLVHEAARLLVAVHGDGAHSAPTGAVTLVHTATGRRTTAAVVDGLADARGLLPGHHRLEGVVDRGRLSLTSTVGDLAAGALARVDADLPVGALLTGRVVQGRGQYAAVVLLLDPEGRELDRTRTDRDGRYVLGRGLADADGLTVVAASGPESGRVTRAALADVSATAGVRVDLDDLVLPGPAFPARWAPPRRDPGAMRLPTTRV